VRLIVDNRLGHGQTIDLRIIPATGRLVDRRDHTCDFLGLVVARVQTAHMAHEYDDDARLEAAEHPLDAGRVDDIARGCRELVEHHGPDAVAADGITYSQDAWVDLLDALPPVAREGRVTRSDVFEVATEVSSGQRPARDLFTASYIWGQGRNGYGRSRYDNIIAASSNLDFCLEKALHAAKVKSIGAYAHLFGGYLRDGGDPRAAARDDR
jgi:hypothetical protein